MALKVELKPGERIILGDCVITNDDQRTRLTIEGHVPILREKDILTAERADSPAKRVYLAVQLMYTSKDPREHHDVYFALVRDIMRAAPSACPIIENINNHILTGEMYKALKHARKLIAYEEELISNAKRSPSLRRSSEAGRQSA
jgi:flagellar protein FlbT